jgi:hypothetical protein
LTNRGVQIFNQSNRLLSGSVSWDQLMEFDGALRRHFDNIRSSRLKSTYRRIYIKDLDKKVNNVLKMKLCNDELYKFVDHSVKYLKMAIKELKSERIHMLMSYFTALSFNAPSKIVNIESIVQTMGPNNAKTIYFIRKRLFLEKLHVLYERYSSLTSSIAISRIFHMNHPFQMDYWNSLLIMYYIHRNSPYLRKLCCKMHRLNITKEYNVTK